MLASSRTRTGLSGWGGGLGRPGHRNRAGGGVDLETMARLTGRTSPYGSTLDRQEAVSRARVVDDHFSVAAAVVAKHPLDSQVSAAVSPGGVGCLVGLTRGE